jgi:hypothetical protein
MTGDRSEELERYKHLSPSFKQQSAELIAGKLSEQLGAKIGTPSENTKDQSEDWSHVPDLSGLNGGADWTRTRDLRAA